MITTLATATTALARAGASRRLPDRTIPENVFYVQTRIEGFKREGLNLRWFTYNPNNERRGGAGARGEAAADAFFDPRAPINTQVVQVWVKEPGAWIQGEWVSDPGKYFVRFELYSGEVLLVSKDSPSYFVAG